MMPAEGNSVVHVVASVEEEASGPSYCVPRLCEALSANGDRVRLMTVGAPGTQELNGYRHERFRQDWADVPLLSQLSASKAMHSALESREIQAHVLHSNGLWLMPNLYPAWVARRTGQPHVVSPHGMLGKGALRFSRFRKQVFWFALQSSALNSASCFHATSMQEFDDIRRRGLRQPIAVIPNGIDIPPEVPAAQATGGRRTLLCLGRLHPKKGIDRLIAAWALLESRYPDWQLDIVGPMQGDYPKFLAQMIKDKNLSRVRLAGPLYGADKNRAYQTADLFVLPTLDENFAMTVAESLAHGTPVISTKGAPWRDLETHRCGWWIDHGVDALAAALDRALSLDRDRLAQMGQAGRNWMQRDFSWNSIAREMGSVYSWLAGRGDRPACVMAGQRD